MFEIRVVAPEASAVSVRLRTSAGSAGVATPLARADDAWVGSIPEGSCYQLFVDGAAELGFDATRGLVDPLATSVWFGPQHRRDLRRPGGAITGSGDTSGDAWAEAVPWPSAQPQRWSHRPLVVHEAHVRGFTMCRDRPDAGTFAALVDELPRLAELGVSVVELMPVHQFDPDEGNYWGYMPLAFGAIHRNYAHTATAPDELAEMIAAAHDHDIEVWLDVVMNHTTEEDRAGPTFNLRGLADRLYYVVNDDGSYVDDAGCGNIIDAESPIAQQLLMAALDRLADLGADGFRFDLASVLARDPNFVRAIGDWAARRGVRLVAEPWDLARYQLGRGFPDPRWAQWNGKFRDDMRGFLRGEGGLVAAVMQRVQGSPDLFDQPLNSINMLTAHDGFTMYDLVAYDRKHNGANGWNNTDGSDDNRSWNCGWEGDVGVPDEVTSLRHRQLRNAMCLLMLSHGTPMFVAGDEFARTQSGNNNPYNRDDETSWVDWDRRERFAEHEAFTRRLIALRSEHEVLWRAEPWGGDVEWFGVDGPPDLGGHSRSLAWHVGDLYVMANMWWEPLEFAVQAPGRWGVAVDTSRSDGGMAEPASAVGPVVPVGPRSIVALTRN